MKKVCLALALVAIISGRSVAALKYWDTNSDTPGAGATPSGTWDTTTSNWNLDPAGATATTTWAASDLAVFAAGADATGSYNITVTGTQTVGGMTIEEGTVNFIAGVAALGANAITVNSGAKLSIDTITRITQSTGGLLVLDGGTFRSTLNTTGNSFWTSTGSGIQATANGGTLEAAGAGGAGIAQVFSGRLLGDGGTTTNGGAQTFTKTGASELRVQGANVANYTFSKLVVNQGLYRIGATSTPTDATGENGFGADPLAVLADAITLNGGSIGLSVSLVLNANRGITIGANGGTFNGGGGGVMTVPGPLSGSGKMTVNGGGGLTLQNSGNTSTFTGAVQVDGGTLQLDQSLNATNFSGSGGTVRISAGRTFTVGSDGTSTSFGGVLADVTAAPGGSLSKVGTGTLTLTGANLYTGGTTISGGTLQIGNAGTTGSISATGGVTNNGNLQFNRTNALTYSGAISGTGSLTQQGTGTLTLSGNNNYDGNTLINSGKLAVASASALGSTIGNTQVASGAELLFDGSANSYTLAEPIQIAGIGAGDGGAITVQNSSVMTFTGPITLTANAQITTSGTATATYSNPAAFTGTDTNLAVQGGSGAGGGGTISGVISLGTGSLTKAQGGTWRLNSAAGNTYGGGTTISAGTLLVNNTTGSGTGAGAVAVNAGTLGGTGTIAGPVTVADGATVAPGASPGTLTINNTFVLNPASALAYELNGADETVGGGVNDLIAGVTNLTLDGTLNATETVAGSFLAATYGDTWRLINYTSALVDNGLTLGTMPALAAGLAFDVDTSTFGAVNLTVVPEAGSLAALGLVGILSAGAVWFKKRRAERGAV